MLISIGIMLDKLKVLIFFLEVVFELEFIEVILKLLDDRNL